MDVVKILGGLGGVASRWQLIELGATPWMIGRALHDGLIRRVRRAWYALPSADQRVVAAVRVGGKLTCVSLLDLRGVWVRADEDVHVSVAPNASRLRSAHSRTVTREQEPEGVVLHWRNRPGATSSAFDTVADAIGELRECAGRDEAIAAADSALHQQLVTRGELAQAGLPGALLRLVDSSSESGGESFVRLRLRRLRLRFRTQVPVPGVGRVDFLVGERLVIEVDGYAHHGSRDAFEQDRSRDLALVAAGYLVFRVSYRQLEEWPRVERAMLAVIRSRRHLWPRRLAA